MSAEEVKKPEVEEIVKDADSTATYTPVVKLEEKKTDNGEQDEEELYKHRAALYRFAHEGGMAGSPPEWKERGKGDVKLLQHKETKKIRVLMRQEKTMKMVANHFVDSNLELKPNAGSDRSWTWAVRDYALDEAKDQTFAIKFKNSEIANEFKAEWDKSRETNKSLTFDTAEADASADGAAGEKKEAAKGEEPVGDAAPTPVAADDDDDTVWMVTIMNATFKQLTEDEVKAIWDKHVDGETADSIVFEKVMNAVVDAILSALSMKDEKKKKIESEKPKIAKLALAGKTEISFQDFLKVEDITMVMEA